MLKFITFSTFLLFTEFIFAQQVKVEHPITYCGTNKYAASIVMLEDYSSFENKKKNKKNIRAAVKKCQLNNPFETLCCLYWSEIYIDNEMSQDVEQLFFKSKDDFYDRIVVMDSKNIYNVSIYDCSKKEPTVLVTKYGGQKWDKMPLIYNNVLNYIIQLQPIHIFRYYGMYGDVFYCVTKDDIQVVHNHRDVQRMKHHSVIKDTILKDTSKVTFEDIPMELLTNFDKMGVDNKLILNDYEAEYLNHTFKSCRGDFDFKGKRVQFGLKSSLNQKMPFFKGERNRYHENARPATCNTNTMEFIFLEIKQEKNYDAIIELRAWKLYDKKSTKRRK